MLGSFSRIIQNRVYNPTNCNITNRFNKTQCPLTLKTDPYVINNLTYLYTMDQYTDYIYSNTTTYDNSGYIYDISIANPKTFYDFQTDLIKSKWVNEYTSSVIYMFNLYNVNHDLCVTVRLLYENNYGIIKFSKFDMGILDITPYNNVYLSLAIFVSLIQIFFMFAKLKKEKQIQRHSRVEMQDDYITQTFNRIKKFVYYFKQNFRLPDIYEIISKYFFILVIFNFIFFFAAVGIQNSYYSEVKSIVINDMKFEDFSKFKYYYSLCANINCANILIFFFTSISHISFISRQLKKIASSITEVFNLFTFSGL